MADTTFVNGTVVEPDWLNDVNDTVYDIIGDGTTAPPTKAIARANLGLGTIATQDPGAVAITGGSVSGVTLTTGAATITGGTITGITDLAVADGGTGIGTIIAAHNGRLSKVGGNIQLDPVNGNKLTIDNTHQTIPAAGVTLAPTGLVVGTQYFIYAYMNAGVMTLEASTTGHATSSVTGQETKIADLTRTLVGSVRPIAGPNFQNIKNQRFVISWANRRPAHVVGQLAVNGGTASATPVEISSAYRAEWLSWAGDSGVLQANGTAIINALATGSVVPNFNGSVSGGSTGSSTVPTAGYNFAISAALPYETLSDGYNYSSLSAATAAGTITINAGSMSSTQVFI